MPAATRAHDPLVAGMTTFVQEHGISQRIGTMVADWTAAVALPAETVQRDRLRLAATMLCLASATVEPNLRGDTARDWALRKRWIGAATTERVMLAVAMLAHTGRLEVPEALAGLIGPATLREAQTWGLATRLCRRFSTCAQQSLVDSRLAIEGNRLVLRVQPALAALVNDGVERDLRALATHLGVKSDVRFSLV